MEINSQRSSCTSILIGKKASLNGSVIIGRNEDAKTAWPKHLAFKPHQTKLNNHFKSPDNKFEIDLPATILAYSSTPEWTNKYGVFAEDGINEKHVAMSATESAYANERVLAADPFNTEQGIAEEAMVTVVLPYIQTAQEGVKRLGQIVEKHGAAEANGILFADSQEAWYMEIGSGHQWVAQRIPDDSYAVVANQLAIQKVDFHDPANFLFATNIQDFVQDNQLWPQNRPFNFREIFGTHDDSDLHYNTPRVWIGQKLLTPSVKQEPESFSLPFIQKADKPIAIADAEAVLCNHYQNTPYDLTNPKNKDNATYRPISVATTQESHLLELNGQKMTHWLAMGVGAQSVYVPFYPQGTKVPTMYKYGKETYSSNSAYWVFKLAGVLVDRDWCKYGSELSQAQTEAKTKTLRIRYTFDQKLAKEKDKQQRLNLINQANNQMAKAALNCYKKLIAQLITQQTGDSPLKFKMDPNL